MARGEDTSRHPGRRVDRDSNDMRQGISTRRQLRGVSERTRLPAEPESQITQSIKLNPKAKEPLIVEETSPSGERQRRIGSYTSYVQTPPGGHKPVEGNYRARRGDYGLG